MSESEHESSLVKIFREMLHEICLDAAESLIGGGPRRWGTTWQLGSQDHIIHAPEADIRAYYRDHFLPAVAVLPLRWKLAVRRAYQDPAGRHEVWLLARIVPRRQSKEVYRVLSVIGAAEAQKHLAIGE